MKTGTFVAVAAVTLLWAVVWALPGGVIELVDNLAPSAHSFTRRIDVWPQTLGLPGLVAGVLFSALLMVTDRGRRLGKLEAGRTAAWGAVAGLLGGVLVVWLLYTGLSESASGAAMALGYATVMGAVAGWVTASAARFLARRRPAPAS